MLHLGGWPVHARTRVNWPSCCSTTIPDLLRQIDNPDLLDHIRRVGVVYYERKQKP